MEMEGLGRVLPSAALLRNPFFSCSTAPPRPPLLLLLSAGPLLCVSAFAAD